MIHLGQAHFDGFRGPLGKHVLLRERSLRVSEIERVELLVHELRHYPRRRALSRVEFGDAAAVGRFALNPYCLVSTGCATVCR